MILQDPQNLDPDHAVDPAPEAEAADVRAAEVLPQDVAGPNPNQSLSPRVDPDLLGTRSPKVGPDLLRRENRNQNLDRNLDQNQGPDLPLQTKTETMRMMTWLIILLKTITHNHRLL